MLPCFGLHGESSLYFLFRAVYGSAQQDQAKTIGLVLLCFIQQMTVEAYLLAEVVHLHFRSSPPLERISIKMVKNDARSAQRNAGPSKAYSLCSLAGEVPGGIERWEVHEEVKRLDHKVATALHEAMGIHFDVRLFVPGTLPRSEGKAVRVVDRRQ